MPQIPIPAACLTVLLVFAAPEPAASATVMTAGEAFADGNRLFRDDLYWAALRRYRQARDAGMDTPALAYNTGVAHYRAGQHLRAQKALLEALSDPGFKLAAQYNLGLNANALGDTAAALRWFRLVREQPSPLSGYAAIAIARIQAARVTLTAAGSETGETPKNLRLSARIGFGSDDNPFRTPNRSYVDLAAPGLPRVTPEVRRGAFMPLSLNAKYRVKVLEHEGFFFAYRLGGRRYQDRALANADEVVHEGSFGNEFQRTTARHRREVYSAFRLARNERRYFDPDDATERGIESRGGRLGIGERLNYIRYGPELTLRQTGRRFTFALEIKGQLWNYKDLGAVPSYDHEYHLLRGSVQYRFAPTSMIMLEAAQASRRFGKRPAFNLDGRQFASNARLRYDYLDLGMTVRQRLGNSLWFGLGYTFTERRDRFVGYNDYTRNAFRGEIQFTPGTRFRLEARTLYRLFDYPRAFAFHNPIANRKTREDIHSVVTLSYRMTRGLSIVAEGQYREVAANDTRIQYERTQFMIGVRWQH